jgi:hypothetical protein
VAINGARAGMTLEIHINHIRAGRWGWSAGPGAPAQLDPHLRLGPGPGGPPTVITVPRGDQATFWELDPERAIGINRTGQRLKSEASDRPLKNPTTGIAGCCADAANGHAAVAPPMNLMNSAAYPSSAQDKASYPVKLAHSKGRICLQTPVGQCPLWVKSRH